MLLPNATIDQMLTTPEGVASLLAHNASGSAQLEYDYRLASNRGGVDEDYWSDAQQQVCDGLDVIEYSLQWFSPAQRAEVLGCLIEYAVNLWGAWPTPTDDTAASGKSDRQDRDALSNQQAPAAAALVESATDLMNCGCGSDDDPVLHAVHSANSTLAEICGDLLAATGSHQTADAAISTVDKKHTHQEPALDSNPGPPGPAGPANSEPWL